MPKPYVNGASKPSPKDLFEANREGQLAIRAIEDGMSLSAWLEQEDPTSDYEGEDRFYDAFSRQMYLAGIRTKSDPVRGIWADTFDAFDKKGARGLLLEYCNRRWREARFGEAANPYGHREQVTIGTRSFYSSADDALNSIFRPYAEAASPRDHRLTPALPLSSIVALQTGITSDAYRAAYMTEPDAEDVRMVRVGELGEIPLAAITLGEQEIKLHKYARGFEASYEAIRRQRIDKIAFWLQRAAIHAENDKFEHALGVLINGDGNNNAATVYDLTNLDPETTANNLTLEAWLTFKGKFQNDYVCDTVITTEALKVGLQTLNAGSANVPYFIWSQQFGGFTEMNHRLGDGVRLGRSDDAVAGGQIVGIDTSTALEHVMEIGSSISETQKFVTRQSDVIVMSEVEGFAVLDKNATRILDTTS